MGHVNGRPKAFANSVIVRKPFDGQVTQYPQGLNPGRPRAKRPNYKENFARRKQQSYPSR